MKCPKCTQHMFQFTAKANRPETGEAAVQDGDIHLDRCNTCKGTWYDHGELALLVGMDPGGLGLTVGDPAVRPTCVGCGATAEPGVPACSYCGISLYMGCPRCNSALYTVRLGGFHIESCAQCNGMWLDDGEAMAIAAAVKGGSQGTRFGNLSCGHCKKTGFTADQVWATQTGFICKPCDQAMRDRYTAQQQAQKDDNVEKAVVGAVVLGSIASIALDFF